jgi:acetyltransferase-like isoleucine patch superfamily enzyme
MSLFKSMARELKVRIVDKFVIRVANFVTISYHLPFSCAKIFFLRSIGMNVSYPCFIDEGFDCMFPSNITISKNCSFGNNNKIWAFNKIYIGSYVQTAIGLTLISGGHATDSFTPQTENQEIILEGENWIGANVTIIGGVRIGRGAIIAAGAVVTSDIPSYTIAGGIPARVLKKRLPSALVDSSFGMYRPLFAEKTS